MTHNNIFFSKHLIILFSFMLLVVSIPPQSLAFASEDNVLQNRFESAFEKMFADPSNIDATLEYANIAIEMQDYEAAIPPLERILFFNPALSNIKLQLGIMYYNLGSHAVAKEYFADSIQGEDVDKKLIEQANTYIARIKG